MAGKKIVTTENFCIAALTLGLFFFGASLPARAATLYQTDVGAATTTQCSGATPCSGGQSWQNGGGLSGTAKFGKIGITCPGSGTVTGSGLTLYVGVDEGGGTAATCALDSGQTVTANVPTFVT